MAKRALLFGMASLLALALLEASAATLSPSGINYEAHGFTERDKACCTTSEEGVLCERGGRICDDRGSYVFFDGLHPTEAVNQQIAHKAYHSNLKTDVYPMNVKQLAAL